MQKDSVRTIVETLERHQVRYLIVSAKRPVDRADLEELRKLHKGDPS